MLELRATDVACGETERRIVKWISEKELGVAGKPMDTIQFVRFARMSEACLEGHEYALDARLPNIPERWGSPNLRDSWITGYLTELRNRLEHTAKETSCLDNAAGA